MEARFLPVEEETEEKHLMIFSMKITFNLIRFKLTNN